MSLCWSNLLLLSLITTHAIAANISLSAELTNFVPACGQQCFESFLYSNFPTSVCTSTPTLACLCSHNSTSGYTVGEGAVQCIISEDSFGGCHGADAKEEVAVNAYTMCNGQHNNCNLDCTEFKAKCYPYCAKPNDDDDFDFSFSKFKSECYNEP
ncbi:hypothetical protein D0Z07_0246 [Hyphodiscus hymeniophilus]|uniref:Uncharacterized protein n=1 Tax=Hyphodiscus hymeniophilus TaxID=353542 RepID=A0A9P6VS71_9HELO|nr:hypothetical protein D0Z07_0246 [Hyphodiscus hymeniophilus]